jgi:hypothetical protein
MRRVEFSEAVLAGIRLTLFSADKPDRLFTVITFCTDKVSGVALDLETGLPCYEVEDEEGRIHLLLQLPIGEENENRWCLWRPDQTGLNFRSITPRKSFLKIRKSPHQLPLTAAKAGSGLQEVFDGP